MKPTITFNVTCTSVDAPDTNMTYTGQSMRDGESKAEMMARVAEMHIDLWGLDWMPIETVAKIAHRPV